MVCPRPYLTPSIYLAWKPKHLIVQWVGIGTHTLWNLMHMNTVSFIEGHRTECGNVSKTSCRGPWGPKVSWHLSYRWGKTPKNLTQETCPNRGSNPGPLHDRRACTTYPTVVDSPHYVWDEYLYSVLEEVEVRVTVCVTVCVVLLCCVRWWWKEGRRWNPVLAHSLLFSKSTKGATWLNVPIWWTNHYQQYYMPSQHTYCRRVWNLIQDCDVQSSN